MDTRLEGHVRFRIFVPSSAFSNARAPALYAAKSVREAVLIAMNGFRLPLQLTRAWQLLFILLHGAALMIGTPVCIRRALLPSLYPAPRLVARSRDS